MPPITDAELVLLIGLFSALFLRVLRPHGDTMPIIFMLFAAFAATELVLVVGAALVAVGVIFDAVIWMFVTKKK